MGKRGIKPNQERRDAIAAMRKEGKPVREIAKDLGVRPQAIYQQLAAIALAAKRENISLASPADQE